MQKLVNGVLVNMTPQESAELNTIRQGLVPLVQPKSRIYKAEVFIRATEEEAVIIKAGIASRPIREQEIFANASYVSTNDPLFTPLMEGFIAAFGQTRANELLAPSE